MHKQDCLNLFPSPHDFINHFTLNGILNRPTLVATKKICDYEIYCTSGFRDQKFNPY